MSLNAATIEFLLSKGLSGEDLLEVARRSEMRSDPTAAKRMAEYRERKRATRNVTRNAPPIEDHTPPDSPVEPSGSTAPNGSKAKKRGFKIPADWKPPPIAELSEKAREYASRWPAGRYEAEAEAFVAFWLNDGRCRPEWRLTWISRIISIHDRVMRERPFQRDGPASDLDVLIGSVERRYGAASEVGTA